LKSTRNLQKSISWKALKDIFLKFTIVFCNSVFLLWGIDWTGRSISFSHDRYILVLSLGRSARWLSNFVMAFLCWHWLAGWTGFLVQKKSNVIFKQLMYWKESLSDCAFYLRLLYDNKRRNNNNVVTSVKFFLVFLR